MNSKRIKKLINEVSLLTGYPYKEVKAMWDSQWSVISKTISQANKYECKFDSVHVIGLGDFFPQQRKLKFFRTMKLRRLEATLPNVYVGQRFDFFHVYNWEWIDEGFVRDAAPLMIGGELMKERYPRLVELSCGISVTGIKVARIPINKNERNGYI